MRSYSLHRRPIDATLLLDRILGEKAGHEGRIEIRSNLHYRAIYKSTDPAIPVVKPETILRGGIRTQLHHRPITTDERVLHPQLRALWQDLVQLFKCMREEIRLAPIVTGKRVCTLDDPVHVLCDMI